MSVESGSIRLFLPVISGPVICAGSEEMVVMMLMIMLILNISDDDESMMSASLTPVVGKYIQIVIGDGDGDKW